VIKGDVKNIKTPKIGFLALAAWLVCFHPQFVKAGGEPLPVELSAGENEPPDSELGLGKFSALPFHLSATLREGFDDNVNTATAGGEQSSWFTNAGADLTYAFGSPRLQLSLSTGGAFTYYNERVGVQNYDIDLHARFKLNLQVTPRLALALDLHAAYLTEPDFSFGIGFTRRSGNYFYSDNTGTLTYLWAPRFSTATSYTVVAINYNDVSIGTFEDQIQNTFANEFRFLLTPTTTVVADYRFQMVSFAHTPRDSTTHFFLGGIDHTFSPRFNISLRGGEEFRSYQADGDKSGPYFEGTLNYAVGKRTTVSWTNSYGIEDSAVTANAIRNTFRSGLQVSQQVTPKITATLNFNYEHDENLAVTEQFFGQTFTVSPAFMENDFSLAFNLRYAITPHLGIDLGYDRTQVISGIPLREYLRNRYSGGLNFTF
jgi:Putative beta-barrel porin 2